MAKTYNELYDKMVTRERVEAAVYAAARGKRHKRSVRAALADVPATVERIYMRLRDETWRPPELRAGYAINDGIQAKRRVIVHPSFDEQIVHHVVIDFLEPFFVRRFFRWSCGSVPGRGQEEMVAHLMRKVRRNQSGAKYYVKLDVRKCFDTIDAEAVIRELGARYFRDRRLMRLLAMIVRANRVRMPDGEIRRGGIPIGLFTSPWLANVVLNRVDHVVKDGCGINLLVRFMDDMLLIHGNRRELRRAIRLAGDELVRFGLRWKNEPQIVRWAVGNRGKFRFCGVQLTRGTVEIRDRVFIRAVRTARRIAAKRRTRRRVTWYDAAKVVSYGGRFRAFEGWNAFVKCVLGDGKISYRSMRQKVSDHNRKTNREIK